METFNHGLQDKIEIKFFFLIEIFNELFAEIPEWIFLM